MLTPYHVRLAISQYGEQFRAELFTEDLGDTEGDLLAELPPSLGEWVPYLAQGADLPPDAARQLGKDLFAALLGQPENGKKWAEILAQAERQKRPLRLLIDATTESVRDLPYGLLCEPHDDWFLFRPGRTKSVGLVRILRRCTPRPLKLGSPLRVLIAVAEPKSADVPAFNASHRLLKLCAGLRDKVELILCTPDGPRPLKELFPNLDTADASAFARYTVTTRESLRKALAGNYDVFHLLAHGHGAGVLLCDAAGAPAETTAAELGDWCGAGRTSMAFLQVCKAGQTGGRGGFGGVAQQLLNPRGGNLAAAVASTFPLDAEYSTDAAVAFYLQLAAGKPPEEALTIDRPEGDWCWAFLELWARPGALGGTGQRAAFQFVSPYRGLGSFEERDADLFFGRRTEVNELLQMLRSEKVVAVVGDSGSGKTSLLQAGLVNAVRKQGLAGSDRWRIVSLRPGYRPAQSLLAALKPGATGEATASVLPTAEALRTALRAESQPLLLVFDQFEEIFTLARDRAEAMMLTAELADAVEELGERFRLVLGMRSEFLGQAASMPRLSRLIRRPWVLRPPGDSDMRDIVAGPAEHCGYTFQGPLADGDARHVTGLLDRILEDPLLARETTGVAGPSAPLPLLQFALERLWLKAVDAGLTEFTHAEFDEVGGLAKAIAQHAEAVFQSAPTATGLGSEARTIAEQIITALVSTAGTRQPRSREQLQAECGNPESARAVVDYFVGERLLTVRSDPEDLTKSMIDLAHEALIHNWDRLRAWLAEDPQGRAMREAYRKAAEEWETGVAGVAPRSRRGLPGADVASNYLAWIDNSRPKLSPVQQEFATELREMIRRRRRKMRIITASLSGLTAASLFLGISAAIMADRARDSANDAKKSADKAKDNEDKAILSEAKAREDERKAKEQSAALALDKGIQLCEQGRPRLGIQAIAYSLQICPTDAKALRNVILTNLAGWGSHLMCLDEVHAFPGHAIATDREGKVILIQVPGGVQLFDIAFHNPLGPVIVPFDSKLGEVSLWAKILSDGQTGLVYGNGFAQVWNLRTGQRIGQQIRHVAEGPLTLSPDGMLVASGRAYDGDVYIWDVATGDLLYKDFDIKAEHPGKVYALDFTPDSKQLASACGHFADARPDPNLPAKEASAPGFVRLWDIGDRKDPKTHKLVWSKAMTVPATCVEVSHDNKRIAGGGFELRIWNRATGNLLGTRNSPESTVIAEFDPNDDTELLIGNPSGGLLVMHDDNNQTLAGERLSPQGWLIGAGFHADGSIFTANVDGTVRHWLRPHHIRAERTFVAGGDGILSVDFRNDGNAIVLGSRNGIAYFYRLDAPTPAVEFHCFLDPGGIDRHLVSDVKFSTDGKRIIARDTLFRHYVFDTDKPPLSIVKRDLTAVSDDARVGLGRDPSGVYHLVNLDTIGFFGPTFTIKGGIGPMRGEIDESFLLRVTPAAFSADRSLLALTDGDGVAYIFRTDNGQQVGAPIEHSVEGVRDSIQAVKFCPKAEVFLTRSWRVQGLFNARTGAEITRIPNRVGVQISRFSPGGNLVLAGTSFNMAQVWNVQGKDVMPVPVLHGAQVWGVTANFNETQIITASYDHTARIWDVASGKPLGPPLFHAHGVSDATFSPDGKKALTGSWDGTARLWPVPAPLVDNEPRITAWVETMTGLRISASGTGALMTSEEWRIRKMELDALGGPPLTIKP